MYGDQVPVNLRAAAKSTGSTEIYVLHVNPEPHLHVKCFKRLSIPMTCNDFNVNHDHCFIDGVDLIFGKYL